MLLQPLTKAAPRVSAGCSNHMSGGALLPLIAGALTQASANIHSSLLSVEASCSLTDMSLHGPNALLQLTCLDIRGCDRACSPASFGHLSQLTGLRRFFAPGCRLQQSAVATLAQLTSLQVRRPACHGRAEACPRMPCPLHRKCMP